MRDKSVFILLTALIFTECKSPNSLDIDVSGSKIEAKVLRMDKELFSARGDALSNALRDTRKKYGKFFDLYCSRILKIPLGSDSLLAGYLNDFMTNSDIMEISVRCDSVFSDISGMSESLSSGFSHYRYYFPGKPVPSVVTFISGLNYSIACDDSTLGIGLDMYLGSDFKDYRMLGLPRFKTNRMRPEYIPEEAMKGWAQTEFEPTEPLRNFLSEMIFNGKILYFLDAMFPNDEDSLKIGFSKSQLDFCRRNESKTWSFFIENKLLFNSNSNDYDKYISDGPTTNGFPRESPAMMGVWVGWQIVKKFMSENKNVSLNQLMNENDYQKILNLSKYKPVK